MSQRHASARQAMDDNADTIADQRDLAAPT